MTQIFGEENDANGTPYVLLESDMKKKITLFRKWTRFSGTQYQPKNGL